MIRAAAIVALVLTLSAPPATAKVLWSKDGHEIGFNGYLRAGVGGTSSAATQSCFWAPGAGWKYRLGNECENYISVGGYFQYKLPENRIAEYFKYEFKTSFEGGFGLDYTDSEPILNYIELGNLGGTSAKAWIGRREALLRDIYITDYNYMNTQGDGFGVYDIPFKGVKLYSTYMEERIYQDSGTGSVKQHNIDFGIYDIKLNSGGYLALDLRLAHVADDGSGTVGIHDTTGWGFALRHRQDDLWGGYNHFILQYGRGAARSAFAYPFEAFWVGRDLMSADSAGSYQKAETFRLIDTYFRDGENWGVMGAALFEYQQSIEFDGTDRTWISIGARPSWYIDDNWRLTGEIGLDYIIDHAADNEGYLLKQSLALEWAPEKSFFSRPVLRAFVTRADWSESFAGDIGWPYNTDKTHAWNAGVQIEYWW